MDPADAPTLNVFAGVPSGAALATMAHITHISISKEKDGDGDGDDGSGDEEGEEGEEEDAEAGPGPLAGGLGGPVTFTGPYKNLLRALEHLPGPIQGVDLGYVRGTMVGG
jgi:hypothetical protein